MWWVTGKFSTGGIVKSAVGLRDDEIPAILSPRQEWVKLPDGRIVEIYDGIFDARHHVKRADDV